MMITRRNLLTLAMSALALAVVTGSSQEVKAQSGSRIRLQATMNAGATRAVAKYEQRSTRRKFTFELQNGTPGVVIAVSVGGQKLGVRQISPLGRAKIDIDTTDGDAVPGLSSGEIVSVWVGSSLLMSGPLRPVQ